MRRRRRRPAPRAGPRTRVAPDRARRSRRGGRAGPRGIKNRVGGKGGGNGRRTGGGGHDGRRMDGSPRARGEVRPAPRDVGAPATRGRATRGDSPRGNREIPSPGEGKKDGLKPLAGPRLGRRATEIEEIEEIIEKERRLERHHQNRMLLTFQVRRLYKCLRNSRARSAARSPPWLHTSPPSSRRGSNTSLPSAPVKRRSSRLYGARPPTRAARPVASRRVAFDFGALLRLVTSGRG